MHSGDRKWIAPRSCSGDGDEPGFAGPAAAGTSVRFQVLLDGEPPGPAHGADVDDQGRGTITEPRLYQLIRQPGPVTERTFQITFPGPGAQAYSFTFG